MTKELVNSYLVNSANAEGLAKFITETLESLPEKERIAYVEDEQGRPAMLASFIRETLSDGSTVVDLVITFAG